MAMRKMFGKKERTRAVGDGARTIENTETITYPDGSKKTVTTRTTKSSATNGDPFDSFHKDMKNGFNDEDSFDSFHTDMKNGFNDDASKSTPPCGTSQSSPSEAAKGPLKDQALNAHNKYRGKHGSPALTWSDEIARDCQAWADKLAKANKLQHATKEERKGYGENIAMFSSRFESAGDEATNMWYSEVAKYDFKKSGFKSGTGHFTQVVWKESEELGLARAKTSDGRATYVVARYKPAGNMLGDFDKNVFPTK